MKGQARTKTQKRRLAQSIESKAFMLFGEGLISAAQYEKILQLTRRVINKLK